MKFRNSSISPDQIITRTDFRTSEELMLPTVDMDVNIGGELWYSHVTGGMARSILINIPYEENGNACPDWGKCAFCGLPQIVSWYIETYFPGKIGFSDESLIALFKTALKLYQETHRWGLDVSVVKIFNAGSFLQMPFAVQEAIMHIIAELDSVVHVVIESRAQLTTYAALKPLVEILNKARVPKKLQLFIGVETANDMIRARLGKGQNTDQIAKAVAAMKMAGVLTGAYALYKPWPMTEEEAQKECMATADLIFDTLCFDTMNINPTSVAEGGRGLQKKWEKGKFKIPTITGFMQTLYDIRTKYPGKQLVLGSTREIGGFLSSLSDMNPKGVPFGEDGTPIDPELVHPRDMEGYALFNKFRATCSDHTVLDEFLRKEKAA